MTFTSSELLEVSSVFQAGFAETVRKTFANATYLGRTLTLMKREHPKGLRQWKVGGVAKYEVSQRLLDEWERMA